MVDSRPVKPAGPPLRQEHTTPANTCSARAEQAWNALHSSSFLMQRLEDGSDQVRMWAAYQLLHRWPSDTDDYLKRMWNADLPKIREAAINLIADKGLVHYAFPLLRIFRAHTGSLRTTAGLALGHLGYAPAAKPLEAWFQETLATPETSLDDLEAATKTLLLLDNSRYWGRIYALLGEYLDNHSVYSSLFSALATHAEQDTQVGKLTNAYQAARGIFHDFHLCQHLLQRVGEPHLIRYLQSRVNGHYSLSATYQEALQILGCDTTPVRIASLLKALGGVTRSKAGLERLLPLIRALLEQLAPDEPQSGMIRAFLEQAANWVENWDEAVLKVREVEYHLLISLPLVALLHRTERECLANPTGEAMRIVRIYQSPLLSPSFMSQVLHLLSRSEGEPVAAGLRSGPLSGWLRDEEKDALWKLITHQLDAVDYPFEQILPEPWLYANATVMSCLTQQLLKRFPDYLHDNRSAAVDYALAVFVRQCDGELIELVLEHFDTLINQHLTSLLEVVTHFPDKRLLDPLRSHYREGEFEIEGLMRFICDVQRYDYPPELKTPEKPQQNALPATVRLGCPICNQSYQYLLEVLYVDEECIEQRCIPEPKNLWVPVTLACKNCGAELPFAPETAYLAELYSELIATRILHLTQQEELALNHLHLIHFPVLSGKTCHPDTFLQQVEQVLASSTHDQERASCLSEKGKFFLEIGDLQQAKQVFLELQASPVKSPLASYYLGIIAFQEKNPYEARIFFSRLVSSAQREDFENELDNPVDMANHYLKLLDKREFKLSHFRIISS